MKNELIGVEDLVCGLIYAKKLKELGVKQESVFYKNDVGMIYDNKHPIVTAFDCKGVSSAFTTDELMEILPKRIKNTFNIELAVFYQTSEAEFYVGYGDFYRDDWFVEEKFQTDKKLCNSLAKLLIWCIENKYVD